MHSNLHQELRRTAEQLRVSELQTLLRALGVKKTYGKKSELIERFNELLRTSDGNQISMCERLIRDAQKVGGTSRTIVLPASAAVSQSETGCFTNWTVGQSSRFTATTSAHTTHSVNTKARVDLHGHGHGNANSMSTNGTPLTNGLQMYRNISQTNVSANVKFKPLAFYDVLAVVRAPQLLEVLTMAAGRNQDTQVSVTLTNEHVSAIQRETRYHRAVNFTEHAVQLQLRFCRIDPSSSEQDDNFPSTISVRMNERAVTLPPIIPTNKVGVEPKRPGRPLDVTPHCRLTPAGSSNTLHIGWAIDAALYNVGNPFTSAAMYQPTHAFALYLVRKVTVDELIARMHRSAVLPISDTRRLLSEKLRIANIDDSESEAELAVASRSITVNLACPLSKTRMQLAVRSRNCPHAQCFDASTYLNMNEKKPTWTCPVCDRPAPFFHLIIDALVQAVLESPSSCSCRAVALRDDGAWRDANDDGGACVLSSDDDGDDDDDYAQRDIKPTLKEKPYAKADTQASETWYTVAHDMHLTISRRYGGPSNTSSSSSTTNTAAPPAATSPAPPAAVSVKPSVPTVASIQNKPPPLPSATSADARPLRPTASSSVIDLTESDNEAEQPKMRAHPPTIVRIPAAIANQYISVPHPHPSNTVKRIVGPGSNPTYLSGHSVLNSVLFNTQTGMANTNLVNRPPSLQPMAQSRTQISPTATMAAATAAAQSNASANRRNAQRSYTRKKRRRSETETETESSCSSDSEDNWNSSSSEEEFQKNGRKSKRKARTRRVNESDGDEPGLSCMSAPDAVDSDDEPTRRITRGMRRRDGAMDDFDEEALEPPTMVGRTGPSTSAAATLRRNRVTLANEDSSTEENEHEPAVVDSLRNRARSDENETEAETETEKLLDPTVGSDVLGAPLSDLEAFATSNCAQSTERQITLLRQSLMDSAALHDCLTSRSMSIPPALSPFLPAPSNNSVPTRSLAQSHPLVDWQNSTPPSLTSFAPAGITDEREIARFEAIINSIRSTAEISSSDKSGSNVLSGDVDPINLFAQSLAMPTAMNHASSHSRSTLPSAATALSLLTNRNFLSVLTNGSNAAFAAGRNNLADNLFASAPISVNTRQFDVAAPLDLSPVRSHSHSPHSQLSTSGSRPSSCSPLTNMLNNPPLSYTYDPVAQAQARYSVNARAQSSNEAISLCGRKGTALNDTNTNSWLNSQSPVTSSATTRWPSAANSGSSLAPFSNSALFSALSSNAQFAGGAGHQSTMLRMSVSRSSSNDTALAGAGTNGGHSNVSSPINYELN